MEVINIKVTLMISFTLLKTISLVVRIHGFFKCWIISLDEYQVIHHSRFEINEEYILNLARIQWKQCNEKIFISDIIVNSIINGPHEGSCDYEGDLTSSINPSHTISYDIYSRSIITFYCCLNVKTP